MSRLRIRDPIRAIDPIRGQKNRTTRCSRPRITRITRMKNPVHPVSFLPPRTTEPRLTHPNRAKFADFFSIGTNDLTQYVMAADRLNPRVAHLNRSDHPAVLKATAMACEAARRAGIWVGVCGEAAARPDLIPTFVNMGVDELSMSPSAILRAKKCVTEL